MSAFDATPQTWDLEGLITRLGGDDGLAAECAEIFCVDAARRLEALRRNCTLGEFPDAVRQLHSLKGAAGTAGAMAFHHIAAEAEFAAIARDGVRLGEFVTAMDKELATLRAAVLTLRST